MKLTITLEGGHKVILLGSTMAVVDGVLYILDMEGNEVDELPVGRWKVCTLESEI